MLSNGSYCDANLEIKMQTYLHYYVSNRPLQARPMI